MRMQEVLVFVQSVATAAHERVCAVLCARCHRWEAADELLQIMRASGLAENTVPYSLVLSAMGKGGQEEDTL
jgi:hypothetical protein